MILDLTASGLLLVWSLYRCWLWWRDSSIYSLNVKDARRILFAVTPLVLLLSYWWTKL